MKFTVIGWWGAFPGEGDATSGYLIEENDTSVLLECGSGIMSKLPGYTDIRRLNNVVVSHYHSDHIADVGCLQYAAKVHLSLQERELPVTFYGHNMTDGFRKLSYEDAAVSVSIEPGVPRKIGNMTFTFSGTVHPAPALAVRVDTENVSIGYTGDTGWSDSLPDFFRNVDLLVSECSLYNEFKGTINGHLTAGEAGILADRSGAGELLLTHLPHFGDHSLLKEQASEQFGGEVSLAETGWVWKG